MAERPEQFISVLHAADLCPRAAPAGDDDEVRIVLALVGDHRKAAAFFPDGRHRAGGAHSDAGLLQRKAQHVHDGVCGVRPGVHPAAVLLRRDKTESAEKFQHSCGRIRRKGGFHEIRPAVITLRRRRGICEITAAVSCAEELSPHTLLPLVQYNIVSRVVCGGYGGGHARGAPADYGNSSHPYPLYSMSFATGL